MLHLGDAFGFSDVHTGEQDGIAITATGGVDLRCPFPTLIDSGYPDVLKFTPKQIAECVRMTANEIFEVFYKQLQKTTTLSVVQKAIAIVMPNGIEALFTSLAVTGLSMIACPMHHTLSTYEFRYAMRDMNVTLLIVSEDGNPGAEEAAKMLDIPCARFTWDKTHSPPVPLVGLAGHNKPSPKNPECIISPKEFEVCVKFHTAGYSKKPKLVSLTHRNVVLSLANIQKTYAWRSYTGDEDPEELDVGLCVMGLNKVHGWLAGCLAPLAAQSIVVIKRGDNQLEGFWEMCSLYKVTWFTVTPSLLMDLLEDTEKPECYTNLRFIRTSGQSLAAKAALAAENKFKAKIFSAYALTEAGHQIASNGYPTPNDCRPDSVGKPTGTEIAILDPHNPRKCCPVGEVGEIWVRGYNVIEYYENLSEDEQAGDFLAHNSINWMSCMPHKPSFFSAAFDLSMGQRRSFTTSVRSASIDGGETTNQPHHRLHNPRLSDLPLELRPPVETTPPPSPRPGRRGPVMRFASALEPYLDQDFPQRDEPLVSPLPLQVQWLRTGDTGKMDKDGFIYLIARNQDVINRGGHKVSAYEIEAVYAKMTETVQEAAAFGVEDERWGEEIHLAVVLQPGIVWSRELTVELNKKATENLAFFKIPSFLHNVKAIPKDTNGRIQRSQLPVQLGISQT